MQRVDPRVELVDASILIDLIEVPHEHQNLAAVRAKLENLPDGLRLVLPVAAVIETAQHVQRVQNFYHRRRCGEALERILRKTLAGTAPWDFLDPALVWDRDFLADLFTQSRPQVPALIEALATKTGEAGDLLILSELRRIRANLPIEVGIWTHDAQLQGHVQAMS